MPCLFWISLGCSKSPVIHCPMSMRRVVLLVPDTPCCVCHRDRPGCLERPRLLPAPDRPAGVWQPALWRCAPQVCTPLLTNWFPLLIVHHPVTADLAHRWGTADAGQRAPPGLVWLDVANNNFTQPSLAQAAQAASGSGQPVLIASKGARMQWPGSAGCMAPCPCSWPSC